MKKLVVLMLVVGMASLASAAFTMSSVTGVSPGTTVTLSIGNTTVNQIQRNFTMMLGQPDVDAGLSLAGTATAGPNGAFADGSALTVFVIPNPMNGWVENGVMDRGENITASDGTPTLFQPGTILTFQVDVGSGVAAGTYNVGALIQGAGLPTVVGSITVVPEPMTMALLGLGGLFLRRKK